MISNERNSLSHLASAAGQAAPAAEPARRLRARRTLRLKHQTPKFCSCGAASSRFSAAQGKPHLLVCAPSNGALDEITIRLLRTGLLNGRGRLWTPMIVRVGVSVHHSVESVSLNAWVAQRMKKNEVCPLRAPNPSPRTPAEAIRKPCRSTLGRASTRRQPLRPSIWTPVVLNCARISPLVGAPPPMPECKGCMGGSPASSFSLFLALAPKGHQAAMRQLFLLRVINNVEGPK